MSGVSSTAATFTSELLKLSPAERIQLAEDLWDSVAAQPDNAPPLSAQQREEVQRRLDAYRDKPGDAQDWESIRSRLWARLG
ncbi:addiction module protein [Phytopseudomonas dryadis]|uniref:Addiction module protein n=1 Tax=Phytopseudomonas dryadis TaxID=2487520 RepID=A0ABY1Z486_9GAMM|nr:MULTISPECIES: addiction module protein [Pseudomonas]TBV04049.1 addiction module protein [Pseudomonas dryadis]TBV17059.1 addiction module protein [Pseudomonas sp. FRB 230]